MGDYGEGYRDARKHAAQEALILLKNKTQEMRDEILRLQASEAEKDKTIKYLIQQRAKLREALQKIAVGEGIYGEQAGEYKAIARAALGEDK
jgi:hypothetical protein